MWLSSIFVSLPLFSFLILRIKKNTIILKDQCKFSRLMIYQSSCMQYKITYSCDSCPPLMMALLSWQLHGDVLRLSSVVIDCLLSNVAQVHPCVRESPRWKMNSERKSERKDERCGATDSNNSRTSVNSGCVCNLSAHPLYLVLCLFVHPQFQVSECAWDCQIENEWERWKEKMDRERKQAACVILKNTQQSGFILLAQTTNYWFWQRLLSLLILQGLNQTCLCRQAIPNCTSIWAVNIAWSWLCLCTVQTLFFTARLRCKINWKTILAPALAGSVYTFQIMALTHRTEHQRRQQWFAFFFSYSRLQSPQQKSCTGNSADTFVAVTFNKKK